MTRTVGRLHFSIQDGDNSAFISSAAEFFNSLLACISLHAGTVYSLARSPKLSAETG
ncbi:hypothetical protein [Bradyrhizobium sp. 183]|uniref:hypothetical protein n=1 Tax=Bradyrhizobium sp. 183 TaxID=2782652 RepID=UPI00320AE9AD